MRMVVGLVVEIPLVRAGGSHLLLGELFDGSSALDRRYIGNQVFGQPFWFLGLLEEGMQQQLFSRGSIMEDGRRKLAYVTTVHSRAYLLEGSLFMQVSIISLKVRENLLVVVSRDSVGGSLFSVIISTLRGGCLAKGA